ncbi:hypothetical protein [Accumulibacter sp.]|uniref:hypothetical protein n=1 Tax=Accumulibacter sp. TaxID=2053492 RepID=UPI00257D84BE|nr:hypothetical protein [Accumulibacter sp.]
MKSADAHLKICEADLAGLVDDLSRTIDRFPLPTRTQGKLIAIGIPMQGDIVTVE